MINVTKNDFFLFTILIYKYIYINNNILLFVTEIIHTNLSKSQTI